MPEEAPGASGLNQPCDQRKVLMEDKVSLAEKLASFGEPFSPKIVGHLNDYKLEVVKAKASSSGTRTRTPTTSSSCSTDD
jgi:hypothetical protein